MPHIYHTGNDIIIVTLVIIINNLKLAPMQSSSMDVGGWGLAHNSIIVVLFSLILI